MCRVTTFPYDIWAKETYITYRAMIVEYLHPVEYARGKLRFCGHLYTGLFIVYICTFGQSTSLKTAVYFSTLAGLLPARRSTVSHNVK